MNKLVLFSSCCVLAVMLNSCGSAPVYVPPPVQEVQMTPGITNSAKELTRISDNPIAEFFPAISPDGTKLLYHGRDDSKSGAERWIIYMKEIGKPGTIPLTSGFTTNPVWDKNNRDFYYTYLKPNKQLIAKSKIDGMGITYVSPNAMGDYDGYANASLKEGEDRILFQTQIGGVNHICTMDSNGMNFTILVEGMTPVWHPKENIIIYVKAIGDNYHLFLYNLDNGQTTQLTSGEYSNENPNFSPDGKYITFTSNKDSEEYHIYLMRSDGTALTQLTTGNTREIGPVWSVDNYIYFCSNAGAKEYDPNNVWLYSDIWRIKPVLN